MRDYHALRATGASCLITALSFALNARPQWVYEWFRRDMLEPLGEYGIFSYTDEEIQDALNPYVRATFIDPDYPDPELRKLMGLRKRSNLATWVRSGNGALIGVHNGEKGHWIGARDRLLGNMSWPDGPKNVSDIGALDQFETIYDFDKDWEAKGEWEVGYAYLLERLVGKTPDGMIL